MPSGGSLNIKTAWYLLRTETIEHTPQLLNMYKKTWGVTSTHPVDLVNTEDCLVLAEYRDD